MNQKLIKASLLTLIFALSIFSVSCGNKTRLKVDSDSTQGLGVVEGVWFKKVFDEVLSTNCLECHSAYSNYQLVARQSGRLLDAILTKRMPKLGAPQLSRAQISLFKNWVDAGSPEVKDEVSKPIELSSTYESLFVNIIGPKCLACHTGNPDFPAPPDVDFSDYAKMIESNEKYKATFGEGFLDQAAGEKSELILLVTDLVEPMPPYSISGNGAYNKNPISQLNATEVSMLVEWIKKGFPND